MNAGSRLAEVRLSALLGSEFVLPATLDRLLTGMQTDSRQVQPGDLFVACKGARHDGRDHIPGAIASGAAAILVEAGDGWQQLHEVNAVPLVPVLDLPRKLCKVAARFHGEPAAHLQLIGVTGTNGKTSCCQLLAQALTQLGHRCGVIGTLGAGVYGSVLHIEHGTPSTTPDALRLQSLFHTMLNAGCDTVVMEVSSHGLDQHRVDVDEFEVALFTNLTRDHLDYHGSMAAYGEAKRKLFSGSRLREAVLNHDDPLSAKIRENLPATAQVLTWSLHDSAADVHARAVQFMADGLMLDIFTPWGEARLTSRLLGSFNAANLLAVLATALSFEAGKPDFDFAALLQRMATLAPVQGRMQLLAGYPVAVVVDYAHTPDGLESALNAVREHYAGALVCVFGCGGERDQGKRPEMAAVAERLADLVIVTDDNPRDEDSAAIIHQILAGFEQPDKVLVQPDRVQAIAAAIAGAAPGTVVLIAGKGHEDYQEVRGNKRAFSDVAQALACLQQRFPAQVH
jgi:UDP-N-acetylmuramoyl-L-alanyl-D-glutamate--2,6-diaminopimelate ligase